MNVSTPSPQLLLFELTEYTVNKKGEINKSFKGILQHLWKVNWDNKVIHTAAAFLVLMVTIGMCYWVTADVKEVNYRNATRRCWMEERRGDVTGKKRIPCPSIDKEDFTINTNDDGGE